MQQQQHQLVMTEYHQLMQTQAKEQLSHHEPLVQQLGQLEHSQGPEGHEELREDLSGLKDRIDMVQSEEQQWFADDFLVQQLGQLEQRQGQEGQEFIKKQTELRKDLSGLKDRIDMAQSEEQQRFADLSDQVPAVESRLRKDVGIPKEELQFKQYELGQVHEELKTEVAELERNWQLDEVPSVPLPLNLPLLVLFLQVLDTIMEIVNLLAHTNDLHHPIMVGAHGMPIALNSRCWLQSVNGLHRKKLHT